MSCSKRSLRVFQSGRLPACPRHITAACCQRACITVTGVYSQTKMPMFQIYKAELPRAISHDADTRTLLMVIWELAFWVRMYPLPWFHRLRGGREYIWTQFWRLQPETGWLMPGHGAMDQPMTSHKPTGPMVGCLGPARNAIEDAGPGGGA